MTEKSTKQILVVDDYPPMRQLIVEALKMLNYEHIAEAENGVEALKKFKESQFDLVISDWTMPELDGLGLLKAIRSDEDKRETPVLMVTAVAEPNHIRDAIKSGATGYVVKPITVSTLKTKIDQIFTRN